MLLLGSGIGRPGTLAGAQLCALVNARGGDGSIRAMMVTRPSTPVADLEPPMTDDEQPELDQPAHEDEDLEDLRTVRDAVDYVFDKLGGK